MGRKVEIGKTVEYETLETALVKAAEEIGWKAEVQDEFNKGYRLGSVEETQNYNHTKVNLRGRFRKQMSVMLFDKSSTEMFYVLTGFPWGWASEEKVRQYLGAVSRNL